MSDRIPIAVLGILGVLLIVGVGAAQAEAMPEKFVTGALFEDPKVYQYENRQPVGDGARSVIRERFESLDEEGAAPIPVVGELRAGYYVIEVDGSKYLIRPYQFETTRTDKISCEKLRVVISRQMTGSHGALAGCADE